jgi:ADP-ribosylglycohydrolase
MNAIQKDRDERLQRALLSLEGLSVGDAFGQLMSTCAPSARRVVEAGGLPSGPWWHTDDTQMAMAIVEELACSGEIVPDFLADRFVERYQADPGRGYGRGARIQLEEIARGTGWRQTSTAIFNGQGSMGNGGAMRSAPIGAWFADDLAKVVSESIESATVTHSHPEGIAGSVAVSLAAAAVSRASMLPLYLARAQLWNTVIEHTPTGETHEGLRKAMRLPLEEMPRKAAGILGSGFRVTAPDTVPFAIWCVARHLDNFSDAIFTTLEGDGDCDTNCAIVGGIVSQYVNWGGIPNLWRKSRETLDLNLP